MRHKPNTDTWVHLESKDLCHAHIIKQLIFLSSLSTVILKLDYNVSMGPAVLSGGYKVTWLELGCHSAEYWPGRCQAQGSNLSTGYKNYFVI